MKTKVTINEVTVEDLVNLLSTALNGSNYLSVDYEDYEGADVGDCMEEVMARILLDGAEIVITDNDAEGAVYGDLPCYADESVTAYHMTCRDVINGLEAAANGTFQLNGDAIFRDGCVRFAKESFNAFAMDSADFDYSAADCLMQIILFNQIVYG